jgi:hypothetical protein
MVKFFKDPSDHPPHYLAVREDGVFMMVLSWGWPPTWDNPRYLHMMRPYFPQEVSPLEIIVVCGSLPKE